MIGTKNMRSVEDPTRVAIQGFIRNEGLSFELAYKYKP